MTTDANNPSDPARAPLLRNDSTSTLGPLSSRSSISDASPRRSLRSKALPLRAVAFVCAILGALGAGSITVFSLYGHLFQSRLHYSQFQVNTVASVMNVSMYLPVPIIGYVCDRFGPGPLALVSAILHALGYGLAAGLYRKGLRETSTHVNYQKTTFVPMILAFVAIGVATACLYLGAITTCAKNFGKGKYRGLMLVAPIASFGLSGMIMSQIASRLLYEVRPDGTRGDVNVFHFFIFLCVLLTTLGLLGTVFLQIVEEDVLIDGAVEELERSGFLEGSEVFRRRSERSYGTVGQSTAENESDNPLLDPSKDDEEDDMYAKLKKAWLLNAETRRFLSDPTMWFFAVGFWLIIGPGESFINNLGTVIGTLNTPGGDSHATTAATHVSILATVSTVARLVAASLSDLLSPSPQNQYVQIGGSQSLPETRRRFTISRVVLFVVSALVFSIGTVFLASGAAQEHASRFWVVSSTIGAGYGAVFSLTPIIITLVWGVENFGTNFGIVALTPAIGSIIWNFIYSAVYQAGANNSPLLDEGGNDSDVFCYGKQCYTATFWAMTASIWAGCLMILWAWKGRHGWSDRGVVI
ncbi:major facilitator superfamily domain-containing protein [Xylariaceae sp. FL1019]|nr:major facilitator superfamily domain-containing protein [Xylariaceae sp. FL1019]